MITIATVFCLACSDKSVSPGDSGVSLDDTGEVDLGSAPTAPEIAISPEDPLYGEDLVCSILTESTDADGDAVTYAWAWTVDGADAGVDGDTVSGDQVSAWQTWSCTVVASDGTHDSDPASAEVTTLDECVSGEFLGQQGVLPIQPDADILGLGVDGGGLTLEGWFKPAAANATLFYKGVADSSPTSVNLDYALLTANDGVDVHWATGWSGTGDCDYRVVADALTIGVWQHVAATADTETGAKQLFIDGVLIDACQMDTKNASADGPLTIGAHLQISNGQPYPSYMYTGLLDEVRISSIVRYDGDFEPPRWNEPDADTLLLYHFSEGTGMSLEDVSSNGMDGQFIYASWSSTESACDG